MQSLWRHSHTERDNPKCSLVVRVRCRVSFWFLAYVTLGFPPPGPHCSQGPARDRARIRTWVRIFLTTSLFASPRNGGCSSQKDCLCIWSILCTHNMRGHCPDNNMLDMRSSSLRCPNPWNGTASSAAVPATILLPGWRLEMQWRVPLMIIFSVWLTFSKLLVFEIGALYQS